MLFSGIYFLTLIKTWFSAEDDASRKSFSSVCSSLLLHLMNHFPIVSHSCPLMLYYPSYESTAFKTLPSLWYIYTMEYYSAIKKNSFESVLTRQMKLEPIIQSEISQKDKDQYNILTHIYGIQKDGNDNPICKTEKETQMYRTDFATLWEKERVG